MNAALASPSRSVVDRTEPHHSPGSLPKLPVLTVDITVGSFADQVKVICDLGQAHTSSYVCCVNAHMTVEAREPGRPVSLGGQAAAPDAADRATLRERGRANALKVNAAFPKVEAGLNEIDQIGRAHV